MFSQVASVVIRICMYEQDLNCWQLKAVRLDANPQHVSNEQIRNTDSKRYSAIAAVDCRLRDEYSDDMHGTKRRTTLYHQENDYTKITPKKQCCYVIHFVVLFLLFSSSTIHHDKIPM